MLKYSLCAVALISASDPQLRAQAPAAPQAPAAIAPRSTPAFREVTDEVGRTIRVPRIPQRIVSLTPNLTETLYAFGLQDRLVGDTNYCDYPEDAQHKPKVGNVINPSLEAIVALQPDLVLATKMSNRLQTVRSLAELGIPTYTTDPHSVAEIISSIHRLADILGAPDVGNQITKDLQRRLDDLQQRLALLPPSRVLFVTWTQPLMSIGKDTFIADALRYAGAESIVDAQGWPQVSLEEVARIQPDFLVFAGNHTETMPVGVEALSGLPGWRILDAVRNHRYIMTSDAIDRPAPRLISAIEDLAKQFHPEAFPETPRSPDTPTMPDTVTVPQTPKAETQRTPYRAAPPEAPAPLDTPGPSDTPEPSDTRPHPRTNNQLSSRTPRLLRGEGSAFLPPAPPSSLSPLGALQPECLPKEPACAR
jgi:iron complex transport system substrate-binding protein